MKIIIDTDKKTVEVPKETKKGLEERNKLNRDMGIKEETILSLLKIEDYKVISKPTNIQTFKDTTNSKTIDDYMESVKEEKKDLYNQYKTMKNNIVKTNKDGKPVYTNFLTIKAWFYKNFPTRFPRSRGNP